MEGKGRAGLQSIRQLLLIWYIKSVLWQNKTNNDTYQFYVMTWYDVFIIGGHCLWVFISYCELFFAFPAKQNLTEMLISFKLMEKKSIIC